MADHLFISQEQYLAERRGGGGAEAATAALTAVLSLNVDLRAALARAEVDRAHLEGCYQNLRLHHGTIERRLAAAQQELDGVRFVMDTERRDLNASLMELARVRAQSRQAH